MGHFSTPIHIEGANKLYGTKIMIGERTRTQARDALACRLIDLVRVKGKTEPEKIFELQGLNGTLDDMQQRCKEAFDAGFACYLGRRWQEAQTWFDAAIESNADDGPSRVLSLRCTEYLRDPPGKDWDGVYDITTK